MCKPILGLDKFEVALVQYPSLKVFKPFSTWCTSNPTKSLPWYDAYNSVKHNRSDNIKNANLEHLLDAISAIHILLESQYGKEIFTRWSSYTEDRSIFRTQKHPVWGCDKVFAPLLVAGDRVRANWIERREYFVDFPVK